MGGGFEPSLHFLTQFFQIFTLVRRFFYKFLFYFSALGHQFFFPRREVVYPKSTESSSESVGAKKTITPCGSPSAVKETKKLAEDKTAVCAAAKQVGLSKV